MRRRDLLDMLFGRDLSSRKFMNQPNFVFAFLAAENGAGAPLPDPFSGVGDFSFHGL